MSDELCTIRSELEYKMKGHMVEVRKQIMIVIVIATELSTLSQHTFPNFTSDCVVESQINNDTSVCQTRQKTEREPPPLDK